MQVIVPLAGPDLLSEKGFRPMTDYNGQPMISSLLKRRNWHLSGEVQSQDYVFIIRTVSGVEKLETFLMHEFPGCSIIILSALTQGTLCSALAGASLVKDFDAPICVDLADIDYSSDFAPVKYFSENKKTYGALLTFTSSQPKFSYLKVEGENVLECVEKKVISDVASAGTYFYRDLHSFLLAAQESIRRREQVMVKGSLFICPSFNFLIQNNLKVIHKPIHLIQSLS